MQAIATTLLFNLRIDIVVRPFGECLLHE